MLTRSSGIFRRNAHGSKGKYVCGQASETSFTPLELCLVRGLQNLVAGATLITLLDYPISAAVLAVVMIALTLALVPTVRKRGIEVLVE